jgi:hypothetical protein
MTTPHTSDLQTGLTPQNHNSQDLQDSQVAVFCVLQSASLLTPGCPPRALAPHRWHSRLAQVWTKSELANCLAKFLSWFRRFYDESLPPQKHQESWIYTYRIWICWYLFCGGFYFSEDHGLSFDLSQFHFTQRRGIARCRFSWHQLEHPRRWQTLKGTSNCSWKIKTQIQQLKLVRIG